MHKNSLCYVELPNSGLCNQLLVWARGLVFAHLNEMPFVTSSWGTFHIGPILRREKRRRLYGSYFQRTDVIHRLKALYLLRTYDVITEPEIEQLPGSRRDQTNQLYVFNQNPHWSDFFKGVREHRDYVRQSLVAMLSTKCQYELAQEPSPVIGVHVRRGDFRELQPEEDFKEVGAVRTPLAYFVDLINAVREIHGSILPVTVFSDGYDNELAELLKMPNVRRADSNADIVDLLLLSKSKLIIASAGSTFSYFAGFLSDAPVILHPNHIHAPMRSEPINNEYYEGAAVGAPITWPSLLQKNIECIRLE